MLCIYIYIYIYIVHRHSCLCITRTIMMITTVIMNVYSHRHNIMYCAMINRGMILEALAAQVGVVDAGLEALAAQVSVSPKILP